MRSIRDVSFSIESPAPGALGRAIALHGAYYAAEWKFNLSFEAEVAREIGAFVAAMPQSGEFWVARLGGKVAGSIAIAHEADGSARLRWFIVDPLMHGLGTGEALVRHALEYCDERAFERVTLWTFAGLTGARKLYDRHGFVLVREREGAEWGAPVTHQLMERRRERAMVRAT